LLVVVKHLLDQRQWVLEGKVYLVLDRPVVNDVLNNALSSLGQFNSSNVVLQII
jgi:hypothetical protein